MRQHRLRSMWTFLVREKLGYNRPATIPPDVELSSEEERSEAEASVIAIERRVQDAQRLINLRLDIARRRHRHI
jgi:hypothetical protein